MIVFQIKVKDIAAIKSECHPVIAGHADCVFAFSLSHKRMKTEAGQSNVSQLLCTIQNVQSNLNPLCCFGRYAFGIPGFEVEFQPTVLERLDHCYNVTLIVTLVKHENDNWETMESRRYRAS